MAVHGVEAQLPARYQSSGVSDSRATNSDPLSIPEQLQPPGGVDLTPWTRQCQLQDTSYDNTNRTCRCPFRC